MILKYEMYNILKQAANGWKMWTKVKLLYKIPLHYIFQ